MDSSYLICSFANSAILPLGGFEPVCFSNGGDNLSLEQRKGKKTCELKQHGRFQMSLDQVLS
jgi:hypothetical protein